ncbi:hypothetical protein A3J32_01445 [Candidatus Saccharibacteria bacterium RIFCSPLOWO2_02_FULL_46_7]|nr:MAG: hypothetical protein A3J32_01445 [Candidatus Saccharibacteria bacterium RIFCSPLOWO2_02_FULL_46_7]
MTKLAARVLYDDRSARPGEMFADADLIGLPYRVVVSEKTLEKSLLELKSRTDPDAKLVKIDELVKTLAD